jgi:hypothetical protein
MKALVLRGPADGGIEEVAEPAQLPTGAAPGWGSDRPGRRVGGAGTVRRAASHPFCVDLDH